MYWPKLFDKVLETIKNLIDTYIVYDTKYVSIANRCRDIFENIIGMA